MPQVAQRKRKNVSKPAAWSDADEAYFRREARLAAVDRDSSVAGELRVLALSDFYEFVPWIEIANPKAQAPEERTLPLVLWPKQRQLVDFLLEGYLQGRDRIVNKSREIGATWLACAILYWLFLKEDGFSALALSSKEALVDDRTPKSIFGKYRYIHERMPPFLRPRITDTYMKLVNLENGSVLSGDSAAANVARSTRQSIILSDEWAHVDRHKQTPIRLSLESVALSWWRMSTPNGKGEDFHRSYISAPPEDKLELDWRTDPRRTQKWYEALLIENGGRLSWDEREQEYGCGFAGVSGQRIWKADRAKVTYTDADLERAYTKPRKMLPYIASMDFGSGPSWTVCLFFLVDWGSITNEKTGARTPVRLWLDRELIWQRRSAGEIGADILAAATDYSEAYWYLGDPAGRTTESDQESWESNLNNAGVPIGSLPAYFNTPTIIHETITDVQKMLDAETLLIHERCNVSLETLESWEWDVPAGVAPELLSRDILKPKKDAWSHIGDAMRYGIGAALRQQPGRAAEAGDVASKLPPMGGGEVSALFDRLLGQEAERRLE